VEESNILMALITLGVGGAIGYFAGRSSPSLDNNSQEQQVDELKKEIVLYKDSVASHFQQTATMINEMNDSYKSVVQHLAQGSQDLCDPGTAEDVENTLTAKSDSASTDGQQPETDNTAIEPPRDYAPKQPDEIGALSENYGLTANKADTQEEETVIPPFAATPKV